MYTTCFPRFLIMKLIGAALSSFSSNLSNHLPNMLSLCFDFLNVVLTQYIHYLEHVD